MENKDMPVYPLCNDEGFPSHESTVKLPDRQKLIGLTKREYFAGLAMQGILSGNYGVFYGNIDIPVETEIAKYSIECADELLKQLDHA
jgi:hypothetical protein